MIKNKEEEKLRENIRRKKYIHIIDRIMLHKKYEYKRITLKKIKAGKVRLTLV